MAPTDDPEYTEIQFEDLPEEIQELISSAKGGEKKSIATKLVELADELVEVVAGPDGDAHAIAKDGPKIALPLKGKTGLKQTLAREFYERFASAAPASALTDALEVLSGRAQLEERVDLPLRLTEREGVVYIDMGTADGAVIAVSPTGWKVTTEHPVLFRRTELTGAMATPSTGGDLHKLKEILNVDEKNFRLIVAWMISAFLPEMPHPILSLFGQQGSAKSTAATTVVNLVDPSPAPIRSSPRDLGQWLTAAAGCWISAIDNISNIPEWFSDAMCRAVTGEGVVGRSLYTDSNLSVSSFRRCIIMTGIATEALRGDLAERLLMLELEPFPKSKRKTDEEIKARFAEIAPAVLGGLLDLLTKVQAVLPSIKLDEMGRMADFTVVLAAVDKVTGWSTVDDYVTSEEDMARSVIDADPFALAVELLAKQEEWNGSATDLLDAITPERPPRKWPTTANGVTARLKRIIPALAQVGVHIEKQSRTHGGGRGWSIYCDKITNSAEEASPVSPPSPWVSDQGERGDTLVTPESHGDTPRVTTSGTVTPEVSPSAGGVTKVSPASTTPDQGKHSSGDTGDTGDTTSPRIQAACPKCGTPMHNGECLRCRFEQAS